MAIVREDYFSNAQEDIHVSKKNFIHNVSNLFSSSDAAEWNISFKNMANFFASYPATFHEETFYEICNLFLNNRLRYNDPALFNTTHSLFFRFIQHESFEKFLPLLSQNIDPNMVLSYIGTALVQNHLHIANNYIDHLISPESRILAKIEPQVATLFANNNKAAINFLLDKFEGWSSRSILNTVFTQSSLDDNFLEQLQKKVGLINELEVTQNFLYKNVRSIPDIRKLDILEKNFITTEYNPHIQHFYLSNLNNGNFNLSKLKASNSFFIENMKNDDFMRQWIQSSPLNFIQLVPELHKFELLDTKKIQNIISKNFSDSALLVYAQQWTVPLAKILKSWKLEWNADWQKVLINIMEGNMVEGTHLFLESGADITISLDFNHKNKHYGTLENYLQKSSNLPYLFTAFHGEKNKNKKEELYQQICKTAPEVSSDNVNFFFRSNTQEIKGFFEYAYNKKTPKDFFYSWLIENKCDQYKAMYTIRSHMFDLFQNKSMTMIFDLTKENPLFDFVLHNGEHLQTKLYLSYGDSTLLMSLNRLFNKQLGLVKNSQGQRFTEYLLENEIIHKNDVVNYYDEEVFQSQRRNIFKKILGAEVREPLQLIYENGKNRLIFEASQCIEDKKEEVQSLVVSGNNSFEQLVDYAKRDLNTFHVFIDKNADKPFNVEVKIRAENILLTSLNFLEGIKNQTDEISLEDTYFLKNNLGKFLMQSLEAYNKAITRYEAMGDPANKKVFTSMTSEDLDRFKEKIDSEEIKQIELLEKELKLVKEHIINQLNSDVLREMRVNTRLLENHLEDTASSLGEEIAPQAIKIFKV